MGKHEAAEKGTQFYNCCKMIYPKTEKRQNLLITSAAGIRGRKRKWQRR